MDERKRIGCLGEILAMEYLENRGFQLLERNYRYGRGEIDLIMIREGLLVFVEVKARHSIRYGLPEEQMSRRQQQKVMQTAEYYLETHGWAGHIRFDIVAVVLSGIPRIDHFEDAY